MGICGLGVVVRLVVVQRVGHRRGTPLRPRTGDAEVAGVAAPATRDRRALPVRCAPEVREEGLSPAAKSLKRLRREGAGAIPLRESSAQNGDTVSVHYLGKFPGGRVFDTSMRSEAEKAGLFNRARDYKPLQVVLGAHQVIPGFEEALVGMKINETKEVTIPPEKAYGKTGRHQMAGKTLQFRLLVTNIKRP